MRKIDVFINRLIGTFDNEGQIKEEAANGTIIHPRAKHIIGICNDKIANLPEDFNGYFVIEESFFDMGDKIIEKNYLFSYEEKDDGKILLVSHDLPDNMSKDTLKNSNDEFYVDFNNIKVSPRFAPLMIEEKGDDFIGENISNFSNDAIFYFSLKVTPTALYVKELLKRNDITIAGYDNPIVYVKHLEP